MNTKEPTKQNPQAKKIKELEAHGYKYFCTVRDNVVMVKVEGAKYYMPSVLPNGTLKKCDHLDMSKSA